MAIVLAIEPDRRQAAHLTALVRQHVGAELVLAHTTEGALDAIGDRVPDLVLVPALLSPQDDAALAGALRVIAAAAHVRTLTIPVLATGSQPAESGGMLAKWRRSRAASPKPDGCDPAVFGEQISEYLREVAAERAELDDSLLDDAPPPTATPAPVPLAVSAMPPSFAPRVDSETTASELAGHRDPTPFEPPVPEPTPFLPRPDAVPSPTPAVVSASPVEVFAPPVDVFTPPVDFEVPAALFASGIATETEAGGELVDGDIDLSGELADVSAEGDRGELFDGERVGVYTISADADAQQTEAFDLLPAVLEPVSEPAPAPIAASAAIEPPQVETDFDDLPETPWAESDFEDAPETPRADIEPWVPMYLTPGRLWPAMEGMPAEMPVARSEQPDWIELVASLRQDIERRRTEPPPASPAPIAARPSDGARAAVRQLLKRPLPNTPKAKPVQDEWGFFDPEQCGFSTLLAKLEEITEDGTPAR